MGPPCGANTPGTSRRHIPQAPLLSCLCWLQPPSGQWPAPHQQVDFINIQNPPVGSSLQQHRITHHRSSSKSRSAAAPELGWPHPKQSCGNLRCIARTTHGGVPMLLFLSPLCKPARTGPAWSTALSTMIKAPITVLLIRRVTPSNHATILHQSMTSD
jgi:hypothetical protein